MCVPQLKTPSRFHYKLWSWVSISIYLIECLILIQKNSIFEFLYEYCTRYICTGCMLNPFSCALPPSFALGVQLLIVSKVLSLPRHKPWKWIYNPRSTANKKDFQPGRFGQLLKRNMSSNMWHSGCTRCSTGQFLRSNTLAGVRSESPMSGPRVWSESPISGHTPPVSSPYLLNRSIIIWPVGGAVLYRKIVFRYTYSTTLTSNDDISWTRLTELFSNCITFEIDDTWRHKVQLLIGVGVVSACLSRI